MMKSSPFPLKKSILENKLSQLNMPAYKRVMLKISGEVLGHKNGEGIDPDALEKIAKELVKVAKAGIEVAVVCGGGNMWRYRDTKKSGIRLGSSQAEEIDEKLAGGTAAIGRSA